MCLPNAERRTTEAKPVVICRSDIGRTHGSAPTIGRLRHFRNLNSVQDEIINYLQKNPYATVKEVQMQFKSMTIDGIQYHIKRLKSMGLLKRIGPDKGGYWQILDMQ